MSAENEKLEGFGGLFYKQSDYECWIGIFNNGIQNGKGKYFNPMILLQFIAAKIIEEKGGKSYDK